MVKEQLSALYKKKEEDQKYEKTVRESIILYVDQYSWTVIWTWILVEEQAIFLHYKNTQKRKFDFLLRENFQKKRRSNYIENKGHKVYNFSSRMLTASEEQLLFKGLNFVPSNNRPISTSDLANTEITSSKLGDKGQLLIALTKEFFKNSKSQDNLSGDERRALNTLRQDDTIVVTESDKGRNVVVLDRAQYKDKMFQILNSKDYRTLNYDPMYREEKRITEKLKDLRISGFMEANSVRRILHTNACIPIIYGCPKIHKENLPLRPVVSTLGTQWSALAKFLLPVIYPVFVETGGNCIDNSKQFADVIRNHQVEERFTMLSLDVTNLFGSIPVEECLKLLRSLLEDDLTLHKRTLMPISSIIELVSICTNATFFKFEDTYYEQVVGLAMGNPLSPCLAGIYMNNFETKMKMLNTYKYVNMLKRYIDDYFVLWSGLREDIDGFHKQINEIDINIKFTIEIEKDGILPFLDLQVKVKENSFTTSMYTKPTASGNTLHFGSSHPLGTKLNIIKNFGKRIHECSDKPEDDLKVIRTRLRNNGYPIELINKHLLKTEANTGDTEKQSKQKLKLCVNFRSNREYLFRRKAKEIGVEVIFKRNKNVGDLIAKKGKSKKLRNTNVIYKINCQCGESYIGETGRELAIRIKEHKRAVKNKTVNNAIAYHTIKTGHIIDFENYEILDRENNVKQRKVKESYHIKSRGAKLNLIEGVEISDLWFTDKKKD